MTDKDRVGAPRAVLATAANLAVENASQQVVAALRRANVRPILLKGPSLVRWLNRMDARSSTDVDLLVAPAEMAAAERVLGEHGFVRFLPELIPGDRPRHATVWRHAATPVTIDLHRSLIGIGVAPDVAWSILTDTTETTTIRDTPIETL